MTRLIDPVLRPYPVAPFAQQRIGKSVIGVRDLSSMPPGAGALGLLQQVQRFLDMRDHIRTVAEGIAHQARLQAVSKQLAPGQRVRVFETAEVNKSKTVQIVPELPGRAYLYDPQISTSTVLEGVSAECMVLPAPETERFMVEGKEVWLERDASIFRSKENHHGKLP